MSHKLSSRSFVSRNMYCERVNVEKESSYRTKSVGGRWHPFSSYLHYNREQHKIPETFSHILTHLRSKWDNKYLSNAEICCHVILCNIRRINRFKCWGNMQRIFVLHQFRCHFINEDFFLVHTISRIIYRYTSTNSRKQSSNFSSSSFMYWNSTLIFHRPWYIGGKTRRAKSNSLPVKS